MKWKELLSLENFSIRNSFARILYSSVPIAAATFLAYQKEHVRGDPNTDLVSALTTATVLMTPVAGLAGETIAEAISDRFFKTYRRKDILENGDLRKAVGDAICVIILQIYQEKNPDANQKLLKKLSKIPNTVWDDLIVELEKEKDKHINLSLAEIDKLMPRNLPDIFAVKATEFNQASLIDRNTWGKILRKFCNLQEISISNEDFPNFTDTIEAASIRLEAEFPEVLKHTIISNVTANHKAYANLQLKINGEILYFVRENGKKTDKILEIVERLEERNEQLELLFVTEHFNPDKQFFEDVYNLEKNIYDVVLDTQNRVKAIEQNTIEILAILKEDKILKPLKTNFYPKNFPERLTYFTGREEVLEKINEVLETKGTAALADTHGVGKSSVITEFAYRSKGTLKYVLFIRATNNEFDTFVSEIGAELGFELTNDATPSMRLAKLQEWLATNDEWLLLVDNVDDIANIKECHFNKPTGKVLYTSNDEQIYKVGTAVDLPKMTDEYAMLLLYKHWQDEAEANFESIPEKYHSTLKGIAGKFGNHPFSMSFVGSYLADEDESLEEFLAAYQSKEKNLLANYKFLNHYRYQEVATAFLLRFEQISKPNPEDIREDFLSIAVQDCLKLSAYIGTDDIPEELLQQSLALLHPDRRELVNNPDFGKAIYRRFKPTSIFKRNAENKTLNTHRIVQEIMRFQIKDEEDLILATLANALANNLEYFDFTNKEIVERYLPHVGIFLEHLEGNEPNDFVNLKLENESIALLCDSYARYFEQYGNYTKAEKYFVYFNEFCKEIIGIDQILLSASYNNLALLYYSQGRYEEAELLYLKALEIKEKVLGDNHSDTAQSYNDLALLYYSQGRYEEAELLYLKAIKIREKELGENHPLTAFSYNDLALLYYSQGRYNEAELLYLKAVKIREKVLGENHPYTALSYNNLALLYYSLGRYEEAEPYYLKAVKIREDELGENHPDTAQSYNNLAMLYQLQGRYEEAEPYHLKAVENREKVLGENHPDTAISYNNLALLYYSQGRYEEAEPYYLKAVEIREKVLGENHPLTATTYNNLASLYSVTNRFKLAKEYQQKSLTIRLKNFEENHPDVAQSYWCFGTFCQEENNYREALNNYYKAREIYLKFFSSEHPNVKGLQSFIDNCENLLKKDQ